VELQIDSQASLVVTFARARDWNSLAVGSQRLAETLRDRPFQACSWASTSAEAWGDTVLRGEGEQAIERVARLARQMARRDVPHWLALELERVHLSEYVIGRRDEPGRERVRSLAESFEAKAIAAEAT